jgi:dihydroorotase
VAKVFDSDPAPSVWSIEAYTKDIQDASGNAFSSVIVPLYLSMHTTPDMIENGAKYGVLKAAKYYPPHGTTNADSGRPLQTYIDNGVLKAMEETDTVLCLHGEEHDLSSSAYFDKDKNAEDLFYRETLPRLIDRFPNLRIVGEHLTTKTAVDLIASAGDRVAGSITPQHLLYTVGDLIKGLKYHLYCLPVLKFEEDRQALHDAVTSAKNKKFFAGTDSAPHVRKATECGCAAGCFTGGIAPQLYAQAFEEAGSDLSTQAAQNTFKAFLCDIGPTFYGLPSPTGTFTLTKAPQALSPLDSGDGIVTPLPLGLGLSELPWSLHLNS